MVTMHIPLDDEDAKRLSALAEKQGKSAETLIAETTRQFIEYTEGFLADVEAGIADADAGRVSPVDDVHRRLGAKLFRHTS